MGKKSKAKGNGKGGKHRSAMRRNLADKSLSQVGKPDMSGFTPELQARLARGLSPEEMKEPGLLQQIAQASANSPGIYAFSEAISAPTAAPVTDLPELSTDDTEPGEPELPQGGVMPLRPSQVLDLHAQVYERLAHRDPLWHGYIGSFMEDALKRGVESQQDAYEKWGVMFQPAMGPDQYMGIIARQLSTARTYQVSAKMVDVVDAVYEKTAAQVSSLQSEDVPWPNGFVYLDRPFILHDRHSRVVKNRALSWNMERVRYGERDDANAPTVPAVRIVCWSWWADEDDYSDEVTAQVMREMGGLSIAHSIIIPFGEEYRGLEERRAEGAPPDDVSRWLHALWLMMESTVPAMRRAADIERHVKRRAMKSLNQADVTVVLLRRSESKELEEGDAGHRYVDWSCRWPVQGFWRHHHKQHHHAVPDQTRMFCLICDTKISWVRPHLRGPSDKPLRSARQLYRLAR